MNNIHGFKIVVNDYIPDDTILVSPYTYKLLKEGVDKCSPELLEKVAIISGLSGAK